MLYLLHFDPRYRHAGHYLGYTEDLPKRFALHIQGKGSPLVKAAVNNGSRIVLVRVWDEDGNAEQEIKRGCTRSSAFAQCAIREPRNGWQFTRAFSSTSVLLKTLSELWLLS
jgi:predicted GIY-YIG superfamily endonuclease